MVLHNLPPLSHQITTLCTALFELPQCLFMKVARYPSPFTAGALCCDGVFITGFARIKPLFLFQLPRFVIEILATRTPKAIRLSLVVKDAFVEVIAFIADRPLHRNVSVVA